MNHPETLELFPRWREKDLDELLWECRELLEDMEFPTVARWRAEGGRVVGHFQVYFPEEIVHAAGLLPFRVRGAPIEPLQADSRFGSYLCSILKTSLELALSGRVELDLFVTHPICDAARNLAGVWGRNADHRCEILYLPQNATASHAPVYLTGEYDRLRREVEAVAGRAVTDDDLRESIRIYNRESSAPPRALRAEAGESLARLRRRVLRPHGHRWPDASGGAQSDPGGGPSPAPAA
jgi:benzoyl-CoA reductase subunit C